MESSSMFPYAGDLPYRVNLNGGSCIGSRGLSSSQRKMPFHASPKDEVFTDVSSAPQPILRPRLKRPYTSLTNPDLFPSAAKYPRDTEEIHTVLSVFQALEIPNEIILMILDFAEYRGLRITRRKDASGKVLAIPRVPNVHDPWDPRHKRVLNYYAFVETHPIESMPYVRTITAFQAEVHLQGGIQVPSTNIWQSLEFVKFRQWSQPRSSFESVSRARERSTWAAKRGADSPNEPSFAMNGIRWVSFQPHHYERLVSGEATRSYRSVLTMLILV